MNTEVLLWLDDERNPHEGNWLLEYAAPWHYDRTKPVVWVKNYKQFVDYITANGLPEKICFDHDLGVGETGYDCAKWLVDYCMDNSLPVPQHNSQSGNTGGRINILQLLYNFQKHQQQ
jgi:hypothetical protein